MPNCFAFRQALSSCVYLGSFYIVSALLPFALPLVSISHSIDYFCALLGEVMDYIFANF